MLKTDEDALVCDLAEVYGIYDLRSLPLRKVATFSVGLGDDSRIYRKMRNQRASMSEILQAITIDRLGMLVNILSGSKSNKLPSILEWILDEEKKDDGSEIESFESGDDFEMRWSILNAETEG